MEYYSIIRTDNHFKVEHKIKLKNGYKFNHKYDITLYNPSITKTILLTRIEKMFKKIIDLINDEDDSGNELSFKIDSLKKLIIETYLPYISRKDAEEYLIKLKKIEDKLAKKKTKSK